MEEEYYKTQSIANGGGTLPQQFFYGVGLGTCTIAFFWVYNNFYPVTTERLLTDAAFAWCKAEVYSERVFNAIGAVIAPFINLFKTYTPEVDLFLHSEDGTVIETTYQEFINKTTGKDFPYIEYYITNDNDESCCRIYRSTEALISEMSGYGRQSASTDEGDLQEETGFSSSFRILSVAINYNDENNNPIEKMIAMPPCNYYITGNKLFDRDFLEKTLEIFDLPETYTITIVDNNVNTIVLQCNDNQQDSILLKKDGFEKLTHRTNDDRFNMDDCEDADSTEEDCYNSNRGFFGWFTSSNDNNKPKEA